MIKFKNIPFWLNAQPSRHTGVEALLSTVEIVVLPTALPDRGWAPMVWEEAIYPHFVGSEAVVPPLEIKEAALMICESSFHLEEQNVFV